MIAVAGQIGLGAVAASRLRRTATAAPLLGLAVCMALWTLAARANRMRLDRSVWHWVGSSTAPWLVVMGVLYVYRFLGRKWDAGVGLIVAVAGALSAPAFVARWSPAAAAMEQSVAWDLLLLAALVVGVTLCVARLRTAKSRFAGAYDKVTFRLVAGAWVAGFIAGVSETLADFGVPALRVGPAALLVTTAMLLAATLRTETPRASDRVAIGFGLGTAAIVASLLFQGIALTSASTRDGVIIAATVSSLLLVAITIWPVASLIRARRAEAERLVFLGRISDQLAHDVRNPLAAIRGATDFLRVELEGDGRPELGEMLDVIDVESRRVEQTLGVYRRLGALAPEVEPVDLADLATRAVRNIEADGAIEVGVALEPSPAVVDPALVLPALENLLRNAVEATEARGTVELHTNSDELAAWVRVADDGPGLTAETASWITRPYFTTKATGMGLGLAMVRRVIEAHHGELTFERSSLGGLAVQMTFKREAA